MVPNAIYVPAEQDLFAVCGERELSGSIFPTPHTYGNGSAPFRLLLNPNSCYKNALLPPRIQISLVHLQVPFFPAPISPMSPILNSFLFLVVFVNLSAGPVPDPVALVGLPGEIKKIGCNIPR